MMDAVDRFDWTKLDRAALDAALNNGAAVSNSATMVADWDERSEELRERPGTLLDVRYGQRERNVIDILIHDVRAPTLVFIHGGYWQSRAKETFTFIANGPLAHGLNVALPGYTLAPDARIDDMTAEIGQAIDAVANVIGSAGGRPQLWLSGWSAGAHLAATQVAHPLVLGGLAISGVFDLEPIAASYLNDKLGLDTDDVARNSPARHLPAISAPLAIAVGADELPLLRQQSRRFASARAEAGLEGAFREIAGTNHFSILEQLARPDGELTSMLLHTVQMHTKQEFPHEP